MDRVPNQVILAYERLLMMQKIGIDYRYDVQPIPFACSLIANFYTTYLEFASKNISQNFVSTKSANK